MDYADVGNRYLVEHAVRVDGRRFYVVSNGAWIAPCQVLSIR